MRPKHVWHVCWTTDSCGRKRDTNKVRASLTVFETVRHDAKGKSLNLCLGLFGGVPISEDPREINDLCYPATVFFLFNFHSKFHVTKSYAFP